MFKKIVQEKCAIETQKNKEELELQNKETRKDIVEFLSNLFGEQWKDIKYEERANYIYIEYDKYNIAFRQSYSWQPTTQFTQSKYYYCVFYQCTTCFYNGSFRKICNACDIVSVIKQADQHKCEIKKTFFSFLKRKK